MAFTIRNCRLPYQSVADRGSGCLAFFIREALLLAGWSEVSNNGDPDWSSANNIVATIAAGANGLSVSSASPLKITSPVPVFTQTMADQGQIVVLYATDNHNRGMYKILKYLDAQNVVVDELGFTSPGWITESNMGAKILNYVDVHTTGAWVLLQAPTGNMQARIVINLLNYVELYVRPKGGAGLATEVPGSALVTVPDDDDNQIVLNGYFDGNNAQFLKFADNDGTLSLFMWGEFLNTAVADTDPGFVASWNSTMSYMPNLICYCLGFNDLSILAYAVWWKIRQSESYTSSPIYNNPAYRSIKKRVLIGKVQAMLANTAGNGGFIRGTFPHLYITHSQFEDDRQLDALGVYRHLSKGLTIPKDGLLDVHLTRG